MRKSKCVGCGRQVPSFEIVEYGSMEAGYKRLCRRCFNREVATAAGLDNFEHVEFDQIRLEDAEGKIREFHFTTFLFGTGVALDAFELRNGNPGGYRFQVIAEPDEDPLAMLSRLVAKIRRSLAVKHLEDGEHGLQIGQAGVVRGRIDSDAAQDGRLPLLVVDGREISWDDFGRCLMTFEGAQFKLEISDMSEEL